MIGKTILHYKILEKLGEGGMGVVYKAEDTKLKREVAIKFLPRQIAANEEERERFKIEAQAAAALNHPNITHIYAIEEVDEPATSDREMFIVMEYIEGRELKDIISKIPPVPPFPKGGTASPPPLEKRDRGGFIPINDVINYATQIAEGMQAAHKKGIIHRDIKSSNIMIADEGKVKIMDFGLAKVHGGPQVTKIGTTIGTVAYMSPEQARGEDADQRSDIWSFGVVLYEMLTGQLPFKGEYDQAIIYGILNEPPTAIPDIKMGESEQLQPIIEKCLLKDWEERYQNFQEVIADLQATQQHGAAQEHKSGTQYQTTSEGSPKGSRKLTLLIAILAVIVIASVFIYFFTGGEKKAGKATSLDRIPVAVADFVNFTGEGELDALSGMLITSLEQSRKLAVLSRSHMLDILRQMNKSDAATIDETLGREICRKADIHALILPAIRKFGKVYSVDLKVLNPQTGEYLFTLNERDEGQEEIPPLIDRLSEKTRMQLQENEAEIQIAIQKVSQVTTPNLEAYQHYFKGEEYLNEIQLDSAKTEFRKAIELDSTFGLAYYRLAYAMGWNAEQLSREPLQKALQYINRIPEKERYLVRAEQVRQEQGFAAGIPILKEMEKLYPNDKEMLFNIGDWAFHSGDYRTAKEYFDKLLAIDPTHQRTLYHYDQTLVGYYTNPNYFSGDLNIALQNAQEAIRETPNNVGLVEAITMIYINMGEYEKAEARVQSYIDNSDNYLSEHSDRHILESAYMYAGKYDTALQILNMEIEEARKQNDINSQVYACIVKSGVEWIEFKNTKAIKEAIQMILPLLEQHFVPFGWENTAALYAFVGNYEQAEIILKTHPSPGAAPLQIIIHCLIGECDQAEVLFSALDNAPIPTFVKLWCMYNLGECFLKAGQLEKSEKILLQAQSIKGSFTEPFRAMYYPRAFFWLGKIYQQKGEPEKAVRNYEKFLELWKNADSDLPQLNEAKERLAKLQGA